MTKTVFSKPLSAMMLAGLLIISLLAAGCSHQNAGQSGGDKSQTQIQADAKARAAGLAAQAQQQRH